MSYAKRGVGLGLPMTDNAASVFLAECGGLVDRLAGLAQLPQFQGSKIFFVSLQGLRGARQVGNRPFGDDIGRVGAFWDL